MDQSVQYMNTNEESHRRHSSRDLSIFLQISSPPIQCHPLVSIHVMMTYANHFPATKI